RVISQIAGEFNYQYEYTPIQYAPQDPNMWNVQTLVTAVQMPDGGVHSYTFNYRGDVLEERVRLVQDGSLSVLITSYQYDKYGNLTEYDFPRTDLLVPGTKLLFTYADLISFPDI